MNDNTLGPYLLGPNDTDGNGIYCGDALELAQTIPGCTIDIVFTSPPYNVGIKYESFNDRLPIDEFTEFNRAWLYEAFRVTKENGRLYAVVSDAMIWSLRPLAEDVGWRFHQIIVWCKPNLVGGMRITKDWNVLTEWCLLFHKGKRTKMIHSALSATTHNWIVQPSTQSNFGGFNHKCHPAQMSYYVALAWLSRTPGDIVFDPFIGSGTTAMAAKTLGKRWIGFDSGDKTCNVARERVRNTQPPLFIPEPQQTRMEL